MKSIRIVLSIFALILPALVIGTAGTQPLVAQNRMTLPFVSTDTGHIALGLALRKLAVSGTFMQTAAHPDDEHNALYALFTHGMGLRSIDVQTNRGDGGQNEIGPELFQDIAVLRTSELLSAHRLDGAEQYFTRAIDYGYSFDPEEVIKKWGRQEIVGDFVRLIRTFRPDVILTMNIQGRGGDRAHEATTVLTREAYFAAGNAAMFPEQMKQGLRPWQPAKLYLTNFGASAGGARVDTADYDGLLCRTYAGVGFDAHSYHKCQGIGGLPPLPGFPGRGRGFFGQIGYELVDSRVPGQMENGKITPAAATAGMFDGIDVRLTALTRFAEPRVPEALRDGLATVSLRAGDAQKAFDAGQDDATVGPLEIGLTTLRGILFGLDHMDLSESARDEIRSRLELKERDWQNALLAAHRVSFDAVADDGLVVPGQPLEVSALAVNHGASEIRVTNVEVKGLDGVSACRPAPVKNDAVYTCAAKATVPAGAKLTTPYFHDNYWKDPESPAIDIFDADVPFGVPFRPTPFRVVFHLQAGAADLTRELPLQFRYLKDVYNGDKRMELNVVPALSVQTMPPLAVIPMESAAASRDVHVTVTNSMKSAAHATVRLEVPAGWRVSPTEAAISFAHEDESISALFHVSAPASVKPGSYSVRAVAKSSATGSTTFTNGYQEIEYPHIERRQIIKPAETSVEVLDVKTVPGLTVGYIVGVGDQVPPAIEQLGASLVLIDQDELAFGDLSRYDVIITGVRAYERRADLRAYNRRLLDYAERGGTVIVQYNKFEFNQAQYGPYPAVVSSNRVSDETVPVKVLVPDDPVFNVPNRIGKETWDAWVQERGLYFLGAKDPKYVDLVSMVDSFPDNQGEKLGSFVEARVGKGRWLYLGLGLWRQLPAGTPGAYRLLANLLALGKK